MPPPDAPIAIRRAVAADVDAVHALTLAAILTSARDAYTPAQLDAWRARIERDRHAHLIAAETTFVASVGGAVAGWVSVIVAEHELDQIYVAPEAGGLGVGRALLAAGEAAGRAAGLVALDARVSRRAQGTFAAAGWAVVADEVVALGAERLPRAHMRKTL